MAAAGPLQSLLTLVKRRIGQRAAGRLSTQRGRKYSLSLPKTPFLHSLLFYLTKKRPRQASDIWPLSHRPASFKSRLHRFCDFSIRGKLAPRAYLVTIQRPSLGIQNLNTKKTEPGLCGVPMRRLIVRKCVPRPKIITGRGTQL